MLPMYRLRSCVTLRSHGNRLLIWGLHGDSGANGGKCDRAGDERRAHSRIARSIPTRDAPTSRACRPSHACHENNPPAASMNGPGLDTAIESPCIEREPPDTPPKPTRMADRRPRLCCRSASSTWTASWKEIASCSSRARAWTSSSWTSVETAASAPLWT